MTSFRYRTETCPDCSGGKVTIAVNIGAPGDGYYRDLTCNTCDGFNEVDADCITCGKLEPLNDALECERCVDSATLPIAEFEAKYGLTRCEGDPFLRRVA